MSSEAMNTHTLLHAVDDAHSEIILGGHFTLSIAIYSRCEYKQKLW